MTFGELKPKMVFTIENETDALFYKESNRDDGATNAYKIKSRFDKCALDPVYFQKSYNIIPMQNSIEISEEHDKLLIEEKQKGEKRK